MARVMDSKDAGPPAFDVKLTMATGRHSPECDPRTIKVNAETKVYWFFVEGAFVLHDVHSRDSAQLQKDFDLFLVRPGKDDIVLNTSREIADYGIKKGDELQFRHKTLPITICVELHGGDKRNIEVNSGYPVMDIVPKICEQIEIGSGEELSLAFPSDEEGETGKATHVKWLDPTSSLVGQDVKDGATLQLRKKYFILNNDITEALDGNETLSDIICEQIHHHFVRASFVGGQLEPDSTLAKVSALLHHIYQGSENISDDSAANKVIPQSRHNDSSFYAQAVTAYYDRVGTFDIAEAKAELLKLFRHQQSMLLIYYPVKTSEEGDECFFVVDSNALSVCVEEEGRLKGLERQRWRLRDLRGTGGNYKDQNLVKVNILGSWHDFYTKYAGKIETVVMEAQILAKKRADKNRQSSVVRLSPDALTTSSSATVSSGHTELNLTTKPSSYEWPKPDSPTTSEVSGEEDKREEEEEEERGEMVTESSTSEETATAIVTAAAVGHTLLSASAGKTEEEEASISPNASRQSVEATIETGPVVEEAGVVLDQGDQASASSKPASTSSTPSVGRRPHPVVVHAIMDDVISTHATPPSTPEKVDLSAADRRRRSHSGTSSSSAKSCYIPDYINMPYSDILGDYKLFHIIVMKQDIRTVVLSITKPVRELIECICSTFGICNPSHGQFSLWIPSGVQQIFRKYGGRPKSRIGKFRRRSSSFNALSVGNASCKMEMDKPLKDQFDFNIKPFMLYLGCRPPSGAQELEEDVDIDMPDDATQNAGTEWPGGENRDVARYRRFYQGWLGVVQGAYPVERGTAVKMAAMLSRVYFAADPKDKNWPPPDYNVKDFLPERLRQTFGITSEVEREVRSLEGLSVQECISSVITTCEKLLTHRGLFFEVSEPVKTDIMMGVIPWNKMQQRIFGINHRGIFNVDRENGKIVFTHRFSDIYTWSSSDTSFSLKFKEWSQDFSALTYQSKEILEVLELYIEMTRKGKIRQAPARPPSLLVEASPHHAQPKRSPSGSRKLSAASSGSGSPFPVMASSGSGSPFPVTLQPVQV